MIVQRGKDTDENNRIDRRNKEEYFKWSVKAKSEPLRWIWRNGKRYYPAGQRARGWGGFCLYGAVWSMQAYGRKSGGDRGGDSGSLSGVRWGADRGNEKIGGKYQSVPWKTDQTEFLYHEAWRFYFRAADHASWTGGRLCAGREGGLSFQRADECGAGEGGRCGRDHYDHTAGKRWKGESRNPCGGRYCGSRQDLQSGRRPGHCGHGLRHTVHPESG